MTITCNTCKESFTRTTSLKRHIGGKHPELSGVSNLRSDVMKNDIQQSVGMETCFVFKHPFTMILAAPTGGGKTHWIFKLIAHAHQMISPVPQRIIFFYSQWQPLYTKMQQVVKGIEFVRNIPSNIDSDDFVDPRIPNLIIVDDLMTDATKNESICNLFTRGSHHRNISVICLMQNLFYHGKENRTMSINSHYLVLMKNPRDQQQISILARQMYPGEPRYLLEKYCTYTERPYGYLVVDLKPDTPESRRLLTNIFPDESQECRSRVLFWQGTSHTERSSPVHWLQNSSSDEQPLTTYEQCKTVPTEVYKKPEQEMHTVISMTEQSQPGPSDVQPWRRTPVSLPGEDPRGYTCEDCGVVIATKFDLQRHIKEWCPEDSQNRRRDWRVAEYDSSDDEEAPLRKKKKEEEDDDTKFFSLAESVHKDTEDQWSGLVNKYVEEKGMDRDEAKDDADRDLLPTYRKKFIEKFSRYLRTEYSFQKSQLYRQIVEDIEETMSNEKCEHEEAMKMVLKKRKYAFDKYLETPEREEDEESDAESVSGSD